MSTEVPQRHNHSLCLFGKKMMQEPVHTDDDSLIEVKAHAIAEFPSFLSTETELVIVPTDRASQVSVYNPRLLNELRQLAFLATAPQQQSHIYETGTP
ncbi:hypothetical protein V6N11_075181 [Hibiscus sabdariffa]|uniref:Uncharacterized protein n=1 Tax=Hibiscus sabdariffa TaxID=183260 RepID=A0ABR2R5S1_9ROSI